MNDLFRKPPNENAPALALRLRRAAQALDVSERTLWSWAKDGSIPVIRRGGTVLFPVDALRRWLEQQAEAATGGEGVSQ